MVVWESSFLLRPEEKNMVYLHVLRIRFRHESSLMVSFTVYSASADWQPAKRMHWRFSPNSTGPWFGMLYLVILVFHRAQTSLFYPAVWRIFFESSLFFFCFTQNVRRVALVTFNSAAHNKPSLIRDLLEQILPRLYNETKVRVG